MLSSARALWAGGSPATKGHKVVLYDVDKERAKHVAGKLRCSVAGELEPAVQGSDVVIVIVPISETASVLVEAADACDSDATLVELSSVRPLC